MSQKFNESVFVGITGITSLLILSSVGVYKLVKNNDKNIENNLDIISKIKVDKNYYKKFYNILYKESGLDNDPYKRELSKSTVKTFCKIAKFEGVRFDDFIDKDKFDLLYKKLLEYQYYDAKKNNLI